MKARGRIDWAALVERARLAEKGNLASENLSAEDKLQVLRQRAVLLSAPLHSQHDSEVASSVVIVQSGGDRYALPLSSVVEVLGEPKIAWVPKAPVFVAGLIQIRGEIRPVYFLRALLGNSPASMPAPMVVVVSAGTGEIGIAVEAIDDIREVPSETRKPAPITLGHAGWMTDDLIPCLDVNTLIPEQN